MKKYLKIKVFCRIALPTKKSSTTKIGQHIPCGYSMPTIWAFDGIKNKHSLYRGKDCNFFKRTCSRCN